MRVPEVQTCCFCCPLRWGIILFGYINLLFSLIAVACLVVKTDLAGEQTARESTLEGITSTVLFEILGMGVILNILLLIAGYKKEVAMLRLYNFYALLTALAAMVPTIILLSQMRFLEGVATMLATAMQCYVIILVRSEVVKLEKQLEAARYDAENPSSTEPTIDIHDQNTLI